ncbi:MAG TPA: cysteine synthase family protein [Thermoanaerobaculia bacterium]|nr:cysteine synthase family protein [Thermoanaerobaculia bacterium]
MTATALGEPSRPISPALRGPERILDRIGNTPLLDLSDLAARAGHPGVRLYAKAEFANPGGSVKDRPALAMVLDARERGLFDGHRRILDATSGNTGIAYAMIGAALGIRVTLCLPENASPERKKILRAYGAELRLTDPLAGSDGAIVEARRLAAEEPDRYVYLDQYGNPENWRSHYRTTGPEIWEQTGGHPGAIAAFVTGLGTSGTFMGVGRYLRERDPGIRLISVEPDSPFHGLEGMKHMASAIVPPIYDPGLADEAREFPTEKAYAMARRLGREMGLLVGISAAANVAAALEVASALQTGTVVTVLCDNADKYLSERFWEETEE